MAKTAHSMLTPQPGGSFCPPLNGVRLLKAKLRRQTEADLEEKKLKLTVTAPETTEEDQLAAGEIGASRVTDVL
ncbi:unnamed protein product [Dibothriocephalus latus]|uniref:Uncharacterized protein n=1 Tax=Dibothriocephalus latus TaxID=60516 RepID=A0A3P7N4V7_DIBLA|nr:unnamed protein product [Dibothriocephalus latus]